MLTPSPRGADPAAPLALGRRLSGEMSSRIAAFAGPRSTQTRVPSRISLPVWPLLAGLAASFLYELQHRTGAELNADGWAYWQGAQSIADGLGYRYFSGDPIVAWPPLYSLYLSAWIRLFGSEAAVLTLANAVLACLQGALWTSLYSHLYPGERDRAATGLVAIYIALTIALYERSILAHNLFYTLLPALILAVWKGMNPCEPRRRFFITLSCFLGIALVESHISGLAYVAAAAFLAVVFPEGRLNVRAANGAAILAAPLTASLVTAAWLGQIGGHPIEGGRFSFAETLMQISDGIGYFVLPCAARLLGSIFLLGILAAISSSGPRSRQTSSVLAFCLISLTLLAVAFSVTWLNGFISESRHLLIVPLLVIPILASRSASSNSLIMKSVALLVFLTPLCRALSNAPITSHDLVPAYASISALPGFGRTMTVDGKMLVGPIAWEEPEGGYSSSGAPRWGASQTRVAGPQKATETFKLHAAENVQRESSPDRMR